MIYLAHGGVDDGDSETTSPPDIRMPPPPDFVNSGVAVNRAQIQNNTNYIAVIVPVTAIILIAVVLATWYFIKKRKAKTI